jgi:hypothetical protein
VTLVDESTQFKYKFTDFGLALVVSLRQESEKAEEETKGEYDF